MNKQPERGRHIVFRVVLLVYLAYVVACAWFYSHGIPAMDRQSQDVVRFFVVLAAGLPWTMAVLALPSIVHDFAPYASGDGFMAMVHGLAIVAVVMNLVALNYACEWERLFRPASGFEATS